MIASNGLNDSDIAKLLQEEYDREAAFIVDEEDSRDRDKFSSIRNKHLVVSKRMPELSPVDPSLELSDPTPDIHLLFLDFNDRYFWNSLAGVEVKWSPRMTLCAGLCVYEGRGGLCSVRLSLPLLKLRPRKDLVETLLHEMIHAYLFITDNDKDHDGHGPNFLSHMHRLNRATGANISVYHTFNDEVDSYQTHWWRCDGPCQRRPPYFGYVKRSMNRAPSARDFWWPEHQATCGGMYTKIKEPEGYGQKKPGKGKAKEGIAVDPSKDLRTFWGKGHILSSATKTNKDPGDTSLSGGQPRKNPTNGALFNSVFGRSNTSPAKPSVGVVLSKSSNDYSCETAMTKSDSNTRADIESDASSSLSFKQPVNNNYKNVTSSVTASNSNNTLSDNNKQVLHDNRKSSADGSSSSPKKINNSSYFSEFRTSFGNNSFSSNKKWKPPYHVNNNKKVSFPKDFVSVCVGGDPSIATTFLKKKKKTKKKYVIDELDSNDGLWDEAQDLTGDANVNELNKNVNAVSKVSKTGSVNSVLKTSEIANRVPAVLTDHKDVMSLIQKDSQSSSFQAGTQSSDQISKNANCVVKGKTGDLSDVLAKPGHAVLSSVSFSGSGANMFTGQGYKLGTAETGSSFLSQVRKSWQQRYNNASCSTSGSSSDSSLDNRPSRTEYLNVGSSMSNKRKSEEAFGVEGVDNLNSNKAVKIWEDGSREKYKDKRLLGERSSHTPPFKNSNRSDNQQLNEVNNTEAGHMHEKVCCPVCNILVLESAINAHLDLCLLVS